jgi:hypothetical protein
MDTEQREKRLKELKESFSSRALSTDDLKMIRICIKRYSNEHFKDLSDLEIAGLRNLYEKLRKLHIKQTNEDSEFENIWY